MEEKILFTEKQKFRQWWVWTILLGINGLFIFGLIKQILFRQQFGDNPMSDKGIQLELLDGRNILIGTNKPDEVQTILNSIKK